MALRNIVVEGDPILRKRCREVEKVDDRIRMILDDMVETMREARGVGLAAPQITYIMHALSENGLDVDPTATTVEEAKETILAALKKQKPSLLKKGGSEA